MVEKAIKSISDKVEDEIKSTKDILQAKKAEMAEKHLQSNHMTNLKCSEVLVLRKHMYCPVCLSKLVSTML